MRSPKKYVKFSFLLHESHWPHPLPAKACHTYAFEGGALWHDHCTTSSGATTVQPSTGSNVEAPACGTSPCLVGVTSTAIMATSTTRYQCSIQNTGTAPIFCSQSATVSATQRDFILRAASATSTGDGGIYRCNEGPGIYRGQISSMTYATTSTGSYLDVSAVGF